MASSKQMEVKMMDSLPSVISGIDHHPISLSQLLCSRQVCRRIQKVTQQRLMLRQSSGSAKQYALSE